MTVKLYSVKLTFEQLEAVTDLVGKKVSADDLDRGHPLYDAERALDSELMFAEKDQFQQGGEA